MDIVVKGVRPYDGTYPLVLADEFTRGEWRWIKKLTGYMPLTLGDGLAGGDPDVSGVLAVIALLRVGKIGEDDIPAVWDRFTASAAVGTVELEGADEETDEEADAGPPVTEPEESTNSSGHDTETSSEISPAIPDETGARSSDSSVLAVARSAV